MKNIRDRLQDILQAVTQIERYATLGRTKFEEDELVQVWMAHHLQIIGEAVRGIDPSFRAKYPSVPWREIMGMRNILVHDYGSVDLNIVWETVKAHLPLLKSQLEGIVSQLPEDG